MFGRSEEGRAWRSGPKRLFRAVSRDARWDGLGRGCVPGGGGVPGGRGTFPEESGAEGVWEQAGIGPGGQDAESLARSRDAFER